MKKILIRIASIVLFIELMDTTILYACAIPVTNDFGVNSAKISSAVFSYLIGTCIFIPAVSYLATKFNRIKIIIISLALFALLSLLCAIAQDLYTFSALRFLQGISISLGSAMTILTLLSSCKSHEIVKVMAAINIPALVGTALGPLIGALFSYYISWRIAFIINLPICIYMILILLPLQNVFAINNSTKVNFDYTGLFLISTSLILFTIGLENLSESLSMLNLSLVMLGIVLSLVYLLIWKVRQSDKQLIKSLLDLNVFKNHDFLLGSIINIISRSAMCGIPLLLSNVLQQRYGYSIFQSGTCLAMIAIAAIAAKFLSSLIIKLGVHYSIIVCTAFTAISILLLSFLDVWTLSGYLWVVCFMFGFMMSFLYTAMNSLLYISLKQEEMPNASNIGTIIQQFSIGFGVLLAVGGFNLLLDTHQSMLASYKSICISLAVLMLCNLIAIMFYYAYKKTILFPTQKRYS